MIGGGGSGPWTMTRIHREERLDAPDQDPAELARSLQQVAAVDRWLGGARAVRRHLRPRVRGRPRGSLLDVGTGDATVLRRLVAWARRVGGPGWTGVGVELHPDVLRVAARREAGRATREPPPGDDPSRPTALVRGDALHLPFADATFDAAVCTLTLHHFDASAARAVLAEMGRVSRGLVLVSDLERSMSNYLGARLLAATVWRGNRLTRHDGPLSVRRSFTRDELAALGRDAGLADVAVERHVPFRLVMEGRTTGGGG